MLSKCEFFIGSLIQVAHGAAREETEINFIVSTVVVSVEPQPCCKEAIVFMCLYHHLFVQVVMKFASLTGVIVSDKSREATCMLSDISCHLETGCQSAHGSQSLTSLV